MKMNTHSHGKVLIVDDNVQNIQVILGTLKPENLKVSFATSAKEALKVAHSSPPDLFLLDIQMPEMDGFELCKILKDSSVLCHIPVIFLTARSENHDIVRGFNLGAVDYVTKPFQKNELLKRVQTHIELKRSRDIIHLQAIELERRNALLENALSAKDRLLSILAHDLRAPLGNIKTLLGMIRDKHFFQTPESKDKVIDRISSITEATFELLEKLVDWSKKQMGVGKSAIEIFDIAECLSDMLKWKDAELGERRIKVHCQVPAIKISAQRDMFEAVLRNLFGNAMKFSHDGGSLWLAAEARGEDLLISIRDEGVGIDPEILEELNRKQKFISTEGTHQERGSGLGLFLIRDYIEGSGGSLDISSQKGIGTQVKVFLPGIARNDELIRV